MREAISTSSRPGGNGLCLRMLIDLTASFGAGQEPSKEWMDKHVAAFADSQEVQYTENLGELFVDIANAIRTKSGQSGKIMACDFADRIRAL